MNYIHTTNLLYYPTDEDFENGEDYVQHHQYIEYVDT